MDIAVIGLLFVFGAIIGSFLNVVIYRLHTGKSLSGHSHCLSCGVQLRWYELFPLVSYIALRGACRNCASYIPPRYFIVELLTGALYVFAYVRIGNEWVPLAFHLILFSILLVIVIYDIRHTIIPNELVALLLVFALLYQGYITWTTEDLTRLMLHVLAGLGASVFFWALWFMSRGRWIGLGDAKLAFPLGIIVGPSVVYSMVVLSFWVGAIISLTLLLVAKILRRWKTGLPFIATPLTIKSEVPFAPFLVLGFLFAHAFQIDIFTLTLLFI